MIFIVLPRLNGVLVAMPRASVRTLSAPTALLLAMLFASCDRSTDATERDGAVVARDSAGVRLIHNPSLDGIAQWQLGAAPTIVIGGVEERGGQPLFSVSSATRFPTGMIAVADQGTMEIILYSPEGRHLRTLGRVGGGPGEFGRFGLIQVLDGTGDSVAVMHSGMGENRMVFFSVAGEVLGEIRPPAPVMRRGAWFSGAGTLDGIYFAMAELDETEPETPEVTRRVARVMRESLASAEMDTVAAYPGSTYFYADVGPRIGIGGITAPGPRSIRPLLAPRATLAGGGDPFRVAAGDQADARFDVYDADGVLRQRVSWDAAGRKPSPRDIELARADYERMWSTRDPRGTARALEAMPDVVAGPVFNLLAVDRLANVWVQRYPLPSEDSADWWVFDNDGSVIAAVTIPTNLIVHEIGADYVLTVARDELDVQRVEVWPLVRGS